MLRRRADDVLVALALVACAGLCLSFRYVPMVDLPQHYAMVSILVHGADPAWGFAHRYTTDFLHRPYASVYWIGAALASVMPLAAAMRIVVAGCTVAPFVGATLLLAALGRPRVWALASIPFVFGSLWHWGFLNFLLGTGVFLAGLALVVLSARHPSRRLDASLLALSFGLLFTHVHGLAMLLLFAPLFSWLACETPGVRPCLRPLWPLAPSLIAGLVLVAPTWARVEGTWQEMNPGATERIQRFPEFLEGGLRNPWPTTWTLVFAGIAALGVALGGAWPFSRRARIGLGAALVAQLAMYFLLPVSTRSVAYVAPRHALLALLLALPLLPNPAPGMTKALVRTTCTLAAVVSIVVAGLHLECFDHEARDFDGVLAAMQPDRRVASLVFARSSRCCGARTFPFNHFAAYYQAEHGGDLDRSLASRWNIPVRYRDDYARYAEREQVEWAPQLFTAEDARHFEYVLLRGPDQVPPRLGLRKVTTSGAWSLFENPDPVTP